jgi:hypothetical protein
MAYTKYSLTPANNNATPPDGAPEGMLPSAVNDTMRDMMAQIRDVGDGIRDGTYTMTAAKITGGTITGVAFTGNTFTSPVISGGSINNTPIGASTANTGAFTTLSATGNVSFDGGSFVFNEAGADKDARFEGDTDANLLFLDASTDRIGIGTSSPAFKLQVIGASYIATNAAGTQEVLKLNNSDTTAGTQAVKLGFSSAGVTKASINAAVYGNDYMTFNVGSDTERMRIDSSGRVLIGTTTFGGGLTIAKSDTTFRSGSNAYPYPSGNSYLLVDASSTNNQNNWICLTGDYGASTGSANILLQANFNNTNQQAGNYIASEATAATSAVLTFGRMIGGSTTSTAASKSEAMRIDSSGNVLVGITSARSNAGDVQVSKGISFPATQSAQSDANTLDDYEEGTFTPTVSGGITSPTYSRQVGKYTKIGNLVHIQISIETSGGTRNANALVIGGLPFTQGSFNGGTGYTYAYANSGFVNSTTNNFPTLYGDETTANISFYKTTGAVFVGNDLQAASFRVDIAGSYLA